MQSVPCAKYIVSICTEIFKKDRQMSYLIAKDSDAMILDLLI